ncbi:cilia- and flagella-associated protein 141-like [Montipora capricornis]|uniref:cilia- and flagella-associated protein 141-like n=1 Tax=Montipora capricornis TaxID=246305 RepID=UPI0035F16FD6
MSSDRLLTTTYRYEVRNPNAKQLCKSLALQKSRIEKDEIIASRSEVENKVATELERVRWLSNLTEDSERQQEKKASKLVDSELKMANKELMKIRRTQLQKLILDENRNYEKELNALGKSFYKKRI